MQGNYTPPRPDPSLPPLRINLFSDTQTKPSPAMKDAMMRAEVGDEQLGEDPTVHTLCYRMAALLGKEAAVFLPSGTMCNQIAVLTHTRPGDEVLAHERSHIIMSEGGGPGALAGVMVNGLRGARGQFDAETLAAAFRPRSRYAPAQTLVAVEQTANHGGGSVWLLENLNEVADAAHELRSHAFVILRAAAVTIERTLEPRVYAHLGFPEQITGMAAKGVPRFIGHALTRVHRAKHKSQVLEPAVEPLFHRP